MTKIMIFGNSPLPFENEKKLSALGKRTWQFTKPLIDDGHEVCLVCMRVEDAYEQRELPDLLKKQEENFLFYSLSEEGFRKQKSLLNIYNDFLPDCIVSTNIFPCYQAVNLGAEKPLWADLHGHAMAEAQAKAAIDKSDEFLYSYWNQEKNIIEKADVFSCVSTPQLLATIGELGTIGRLNRFTNEYEFGYVIQNGIIDEDFVHDEKVIRGDSVEEDDFVILWSGGYNTWCDIDTLFKALIKAMEVNDKIKFVSTGGEIKGQDEKTYPHFLNLIKNSKFSQNFIMKGWVPTEDIKNYYFEADVGINIDKDIYEVRLGSKMRIPDWLRAGLPVLTTKVCELSQIIDRENIGFTFKPKDVEGLKQKILWMVSNKDKIRDIGLKGKKYAFKNLNYNVTTKPLREWVKNPKFAPDKGKIKRFDKERDTHISYLEKLAKERYEDSLEAHKLAKKRHNELLKTFKIIEDLRGYSEEMKQVIKLRDVELEETRDRIKELEAILTKIQNTTLYKIYSFIKNFFK
jgi:glycosyltransferase involved in cell wall biosynthesis